MDSRLFAKGLVVGAGLDLVEKLIPLAGGAGDFKCLFPQYAGVCMIPFSLPLGFVIFIGHFFLLVFHAPIMVLK